MFRDFSQEAKEKLISYVNDTSSDGIWQIIKNSIDYMDVKIKNWLHTLDSYAYLCQMDYVLADIMHMKLVRTKTIAEGAGYCDFRYSKYK